MKRNNAILLCGGIGRRMAPIPNCNKSLLKIRGKVNLVRIISNLYIKGITDIVVATNPLFREEVNNIASKMKDTCKYLNIEVVVAENYTKGCNNVVTLASARDYIENTYILETDQYYLEDNMDFIRSEPYDRSYFFTQSREEEDWGVEAYDEDHILGIMTCNPDKEFPCLSGVSYVTGEGASFLKAKLSDEDMDTDYYWEELLMYEDYLPSLNFYDWFCETPYSIEFDNISDLINKNLMTPQEIADLIDDNHSAQKLNSMTNHTYKVTVEGKQYALRLPGYGTSTFVNRKREMYMDETTYDSLRPKSTYYCGGDVKLTEYLEGYEVLSSISDIPRVLSKLYELHSQVEIINARMMIDLEEEISDYESSLSGELEGHTEYQQLKSKVVSFLKEWSKHHTVSRVHRDLVPLNILLKGDDVKFIDWEYSGYLSEYWDIASLCCEFSDEYNLPLGDVVDRVSYEYVFHIDKDDIYRWIAVVDFVWSAWSAAKYIAGDDVLEYGQRRFARAKYLADKYMEV